MIEGSGSGPGAGSGSIPLTNGSGSGRPKNTWIRIRIRFRNTASYPTFHPHFLSRLCSLFLQYFLGNTRRARRTWTSGRKTKTTTRTRMTTQTRTPSQRWRWRLQLKWTNQILSGKDLFKYGPRVIPSQLEAALQILNILVGTDLGP